MAHGCEEDVNAPNPAIKADEASFLVLHMEVENDVPQWMDRAYATVGVGDVLLRVATSQLSPRPGSA